ncbi:MaoC family dehydratase N-terminal domain-containing protein [Nocardioides sp. AE5]|uniref:MaoC family dehydratase N-terminal domain-containing protein n=1 Tax=Nocardioides sp. AE5 TaxID=2962573 RepID=UPI00288212C2|nr:MaoC family dehydratase N-terminal domain-containing protein [Nocardioides sp. AE5]MDT0200674.1 MaoC family dehydratase N-terminal domain-containing protein [Nocardioides sp. AE5]
MALSTDLIGTTRAGGTLLVSRSRLRLFAKAIGQHDPVFIDLEAAKQAGHPDLPVPPTFFFAVDLEVPDSFAYLEEAGVDLRAVLHGEQKFTYHRTAHAGDELTSSSKVVDVYDKKGGALQFMVTETPIVNQGGDLVVTMLNTLVVRRLEGVAA